MLSAFGVDHGEISKIIGGSILGQAIKSDVGVGAGASGMTARKLAGGARAKHPAGPGHSAIQYTAPRATAKKEGHRAAREFARLGNPKTYGGYEGAHPGVGAANRGWTQRAESFKAVNKPAGKAPVGMRGGIKGRSQTTKSKAFNSVFS